MPADWGVDGTSGYDFMDAISAVQHDASSGEALGALWHELTGRPAGFAAEEVPGAARDPRAELRGSVGGLRRGVPRGGIAERGNARCRACRNPARAGGAAGAFSGVSQLSRGSRPRLIRMPTAGRWKGRRRDPEFARIDVIEMIMELLRRPETPARQKAATIFQQFSAPVTAKSIEDTAFYRYGRLISRNDVGFDVATLGTDRHISPSERGAEPTVSGRAAGHRDARPQARGGCAGAAGSAERDAGGMGPDAAALDRAERTLQDRAWAEHGATR